MNRIPFFLLLALLALLALRPDASAHAAGHRYRDGNRIADEHGDCLQRLP